MDLWVDDCVGSHWGLLWPCRSMKTSLPNSWQGCQQQKFEENSASKPAFRPASACGFCFKERWIEHWTKVTKSDLTVVVAHATKGQLLATLELSGFAVLPPCYPRIKSCQPLKDSMKKRRQPWQRKKHDASSWALRRIDVYCVAGGCFEGVFPLFPFFTCTIFICLLLLSFHVHVYVYIYICICTYYVYVCTYIYICTQVSMYMYI